MAFYRDSEFLALENEWYQKLEAEGFADIEDRSGNLKSPDKRTIAYETRDITLGFFLDLDTLLAHYHEMPKFDRKVLEQYTRGIKSNVIAHKSRVHRNTISSLISRYKGLIKALNRIIESSSDCAASTPMNAKSYGAHEGVNEDRSNSDKAA